MGIKKLYLWTWYHDATRSFCCWCRNLKTSTSFWHTSTYVKVNTHTHTTQYARIVLFHFNFNLWLQNIHFDHLNFEYFAKVKFFVCTFRFKIFFSSGMESKTISMFPVSRKCTQIWNYQWYSETKHKSCLDYRTFLLFQTMFA